MTRSRNFFCKVLNLHFNSIKQAKRNWYCPLTHFLLICRVSNSSAISCPPNRAVLSNRKKRHVHFPQGHLLGVRADFLIDCHLSICNRKPSDCFPHSLPQSIPPELSACWRGIGIQFWGFSILLLQQIFYYSKGSRNDIEWSKINEH